MRKEVVLKKLNPLITKGIAHRGLHNDKLCENSLGAFKNAIDHNLAFELDVRLSKDNQLVVFHDDDLLRMTGKTGCIEDMTVEELRANYKLSDGDDIPTFKEVLDLSQERVPIVVELKVFRNNFNSLAERLKVELKDVKDKKNFNLICFDPRGLFPLKHSGYIRSLLVGLGKPWVFHFRSLFESLDVDVEMFKEKKIQRYSKRHFINTWTIRNMEDLEKALPYATTLTFEHIDYKIINEKLK